MSFAKVPTTWRTLWRFHRSGRSLYVAFNAPSQRSQLYYAHIFEPVGFKVLTAWKTIPAEFVGPNVRCISFQIILSLLARFSCFSFRIAETSLAVCVRCSGQLVGQGQRALEVSMGPPTSALCECCLLVELVVQFGG